MSTSNDKRGTPEMRQQLYKKLETAWFSAYPGRNAQKLQTDARTWWHDKKSNLDDVKMKIQELEQTRLANSFASRHRLINMMRQNGSDGDSSSTNTPAAANGSERIDLDLEEVR